MRKILMLAATFWFVSSTAMAASYTIDPSHTYPHFTINHLGFSTMRGRFDTTSGKLQLDLDKKTGSIEITIDAASVNTAHKKRDKHLRSPDFLNVAEYPTITFKSTSIKFSGTSSATVIGKLTMTGVTKTVELAIDSIKCGRHPMVKKDVCGFNAVTQIKRSDFGIKYGLPNIGDEMKLEFEVEAFKD